MKIEEPGGVNNKNNNNKNNNNKKDTIMKAIELTPTTAANFDSTAMTTRVSNFKKAAKKFIKATCRFFVVISPAYPQYVESMQRKA